MCNYPELTSIRLREGEWPVFGFDHGLMSVKVVMDGDGNPHEAECLFFAFGKLSRTFSWDAVWLKALMPQEETKPKAKAVSAAQALKKLNELAAQPAQDPQGNVEAKPPAVFMSCEGSSGMVPGRPQKNAGIVHNPKRLRQSKWALRMYMK